MATNLANYWVTIRPDFTRFRQEVQQEAQRLAGSSGPSFNVRPNLELTAFRAQYRVFEAVYLRDRTIDVHVNLNRGSVGQLGSQMGQAGAQAGGAMNGGIMGALRSLPPQAQAAVAGLAVSLAASLAPALGAALSAGILLGVGGGVLALGIKAAASDPRVQAAWKTFGDRAKNALEGFSAPFVQPLIDAADTFGDAVEKLGPDLKALGEIMAPVIQPLADGLAKFAENALPGIKAAVLAAKPLFDTIADKLPALGDAVSGFFKGIATGGPGAKKFLEDVFDFLIWVLPKVGEFLGWLSEKYRDWRQGVENAVNAVRFVWDQIWAFFADTLVPFFRAALANIGGFFTGLRDTVQGVVRTVREAWDAGWAYLRDRIFAPLKTLITETIPKAFRDGVDLIGFWWNALRDLARKPVSFVVNQVINPLIRGYNVLASKFGAPTGSEIQGFAGGGRILGLPSAVDNLIARGPDGRPIALAGGEMVVNARQTARHLPLLQAINAGMEGFALGGIIDFFTNPLKAFGGPLSRLGEIAGTPFGKMISTLPRKLFDALVDKVKSLISFTGGGGSATASGLMSGIASVLAALRNAFGNVPLISGLRPGDRTLSGSISYHSSGRAIDIAPVLAWAQFIRAGWGSQLRELITPWNDLNIHNGRPHTYTGAVWNQHNFAGGNAHIHAALAEGGLIARVMDRGGILHPGQVAANTSGGRELMLPEGMRISLSRETVGEIVDGIVTGFARVMGGSGAVLVQMGRTR